MTCDDVPPTGGQARYAAPGGDERPPFDISVAHSARIYDYWLGGMDNYAPDRAAGEAALQAYPDLVFAAHANRAFLARAVRYLAMEAGIRQFLDIGTGMPAANNTHEVAQAAAPDCRVVYVDNDPIVLSRARTLLTGSPQGATDHVEADLRDTGRVLDQAARTLDFAEPVAIMLLAILHLIGDEDDPYGIIARLACAVPPGSHLVLSHVASDIDQAAVAEARERIGQFMPQRQTYRSHAEVLRFFTGMEIAEPGIVRVPYWRPVSPTEAAAPAPIWGGVGRKR